MPRKLPKLVDIATETGLSISTVSKVLKGQPGFNEKTRKRVLQVARQLNYQTNQLANFLRDGYTHTLGVVIYYTRGAWVSLSMIYTLERMAARHGYRIYLAHVRHKNDDPVQPIHDLLARQVDGLLIYSGPLPASVVKTIQKITKPCVFFPWAPKNTPHCVTISRHKAMAQLASHLAELGHRQVGMFFHISPDMKDRRVGEYRRALTKAGIQTAWVEDLGPVDVDRSGSDDLDEIAQKIKIALSTRPLPTALIMSNDLSAAAALFAISEMGMRVPQDISVVGFDGLEITKITQPPLTTIAQPYRQASEAAALLLIEKIQQKQPKKAKPISFECELIIRKSTGLASLVRPV